VAALVIHAGKRQRKLAQAARQVTHMPHSVGAHTRNHENIATPSARRRGAYNRIAPILLGGFDAKLGLERRIGGGDTVADFVNEKLTRRIVRGFLRVSFRRAKRVSRCAARLAKPSGDGFERRTDLRKEANAASTGERPGFSSVFEVNNLEIPSGQTARAFDPGDP
jgi:hypothetical protein